MERNHYWSPYLAGAGIGIVLLATLYTMGMGVGASSAFTRAAADVTQKIDPARAGRIAYFSGYLKDGAPMKDWIVFEVAGLFLGALVSSTASRGFRFRFDKGRSMNNFVRFFTALAGGGLIGFSSRLARGCTSGVGLSGSAELAVAGWVFLIAMFLSGFAAAFILRKELWQ